MHKAIYCKHLGTILCFEIAWDLYKSRLTSFQNVSGKAKAPDFLGGNRGLCGNQKAPEGLPMFFIGKARIGLPNYWFKPFIFACINELSPPCNSLRGP